MISYVPARDREWALFLDVDGTLLEIADSPEAVNVPTTVRTALKKASKRESGAVALVSGRSLSDLDALFGAGDFPVAAIHGAVRRDAKGKIIKPQFDNDALNDARATLSEFVLDHPGVLLEDKHYAIAIHYRNVPALAESARTAVQTACETLGAAFQMQAGKCVYEIKPAGFSKGTAVEAFMREAPFRGRLPVFVGDDATDESGFSVTNRLNGISIRVGGLEKSVAQFCLPDVDAVMHWLTNPLTHAQVS